MHVPDALLDPTTTAITAAVAAAALAVAATGSTAGPVTRRSRGGGLARRGQAATAGALGAAMLTVQMIDVPIGAGLSGHLGGAALLTVLLGARSAVLTTSAVLATQSLLLGDGGVASLGATVLLLAVIPVALTSLTLRLRTASTLRPPPLWAAAGVAAGVSTLASAGALALLLPAGGLAAPTLLQAYGVVAIGEAGITALLVALAAPRTVPERVGRLAVGAGAGAWAVAALAGPVWASSLPDPLDVVAGPLAPLWSPLLAGSGPAFPAVALSSLAAGLLAWSLARTTSVRRPVPSGALG